MTQATEAAETGCKLVNAVLQCIEFPREIHWTRSPLDRWFAFLEGQRTLILDFSEAELGWAVQGTKSRHRLVEIAELRLQEARFRDGLLRQDPTLQRIQGCSEETRVLSMLLASHDVMFELSPELILQFVSPSWARITGYDVLDSLDHPLIDFVHEDDHQSLVEMLDSLRQGELLTGETELRILCHDNEWRSFQLSVERRYELDGVTVAAIYGSLHDITKLKKREQELLVTQLAAEKATMEKSLFLAFMSHEIRTPMSGLLGMIEVLLEGGLDEQQRDYLKVMDRSCKSLLSILNDILDLSKVEAGKLELDVIPFDTENVLKGTVALLEKSAGEKGLKLILDIPYSLPSPLMGDPIRLSQILTNLADNAVKFTRQGSVTLRCKVEDATDSNVVLRFSVIDTGVGIPEERCDAIFEEYAQVDSKTARRFGGTGLGLCISKRLTELMGGAIGVDSEECEGSEFWFTAVFERVALPTQLLETPPSRGNGKSLYDFSDHRILIADDATVNRLVASTILKKTGCQIEIAENGLEVLEILETTPCDLILMDVQMPEMSGLEATWRIREMEAAGGTSFQHDGRIPIVAVTASVTSTDRHRCMEAGMDSFLGKPLDSDMLLETIADLCKKPETDLAT